MEMAVVSTMDAGGTLNVDAVLLRDHVCTNVPAGKALLIASTAVNRSPKSKTQSAKIGQRRAGCRNSLAADPGDLPHTLPRAIVRSTRSVPAKAGPGGYCHEIEEVADQHRQRQRKNRKQDAEYWRDQKRIADERRRPPGMCPRSKDLALNFSKTAMAPPIRMKLPASIVIMAGRAPSLPNGQEERDAHIGGSR